MKKKSLTIVLATNNAHKVKEIKAILKTARVPLRLKTLSDFPRMKPVVENKRTIEGNAIKKAVEVAQHTKTIALADDTGLFIDALNGRPGVYSARFAGPGCNFQDNCNKVLRLLKKIPLSKRRATFRTIAALATPAGRVWTAEGKIVGRIPLDWHGKRGFGYDPVFFVPRHKQTFAEMPIKTKNKISHRGRAFQKLPRLISALSKHI